jgi:hypothetical protein
MSLLKARVAQFARWQRKTLRYRVLNPVRYAADNARMALEPNVAGAPSCRILLVSDAQIATSEEQLKPFFFYRSDLRRHLKVISMHLLLEDVLRLPKVALRSFDIIAVKLSFRIGAAEVSEIGRLITVIAGNRPVVYLDGDDDICIMHPEILSWVAVYVKKHIFRDRGQYLQRFVGKSNLTDFVHREYNYSFADDPHAKESRAVDSAHLNKIIVGWNVALDSNIVELFTNVIANTEPMKKNVDVMFRGNVPKDWLYYLRKDIEPSLRKLQSSFNVIIPKERVSRDEYFREMMGSKICLSPFGYGEICWRDLEAIMCGCLLIKPDMSHIETVPNIFRANETYVPVRWDYADLEEKCSYYLRHDDERERIVSSALEVLVDYYGRKGFLTSVTEILGRVQWRGSLDREGNRTTQ